MPTESRFWRAATVILTAIVATLAALAGPSEVGGPTYKGVDLTVDLPLDEHIRNIGSRVDGAGMCVMSSIEMAARYAGMEEYRGLRDWAAKYPGGAYPSKVDQQLAQYAQEHGLAAPKYLQYEGPSPESLLSLIDRTGRMACVTYGYSPRYGRGTIHHMVCCPRYQGESAAILDNNFPRTYEWMGVAEATDRIRHATGKGWVFVWLAEPPPAPPKN